jgi:predicted transcriptional regulator
MKPPCELIVEKLLPSLRAAIVKFLIEDYKMKQTEISEKLGISQSAVSQYYTSARASDEKFVSEFPEIPEYAKEVAEKFSKGELKGNQILLCEPCQKVRGNDKFCTIQEDFIKSKKF